MKVLIGGLLPTQQRIIEAACPAGIELRFVAADKDPRIWGRAGKHCSSRSWTAVMAFCSSARHFSADQR